MLQESLEHFADSLMGSQQQQIAMSQHQLSMQLGSVIPSNSSVGGVNNTNQSNNLIAPSDFHEVANYFSFNITPKNSSSGMVTTERILAPSS